jgi:hypothetical protein
LFCKSTGSHGGNCEHNSLLGYGAV